MIKMKKCIKQIVRFLKPIHGYGKITDVSIVYVI